VTQLHEKLQALFDRSGVKTQSELARLGGWKGRSSVQRFFKPMPSEFLESGSAKKFIQAMVGRGHPPITKGEIMALTEVGPTIIERACWFCKTPIHACFGFVLVRDYLAIDAAIKARTPLPPFRELCGICVEKASQLMFGDDV